MLEELEGKPVSDRDIHKILHMLRNHSIIDNENKFLDLYIIEEAVKILINLH